MNLSHVAALKAKHDGIDRRIREEQGRPSPDVATLHDLKRQKLRIKEEIAHQ